MIGNEQFDVLDKLKTPEQFEEFKLRNKNIFSFDNKEIKLKCYSHIMPSLINQEGIVFIGESVCKYDDKGLIIVDDGNLEKLNRTIVSRKSSLNDKISVFNVNQLQLETRAACGTNPNTGWIGGNNWRRGILSCGTEISVPVQNGSSSFSFDFFSFSSGRAQKYLTWFGYWTGVNTSHTLSVNQVANVWVDNAMTINVNKSYYLTFSSTGVSEIKFSEYLGTINDFNAFSRDEAINNAFTMFKNFTSINNTYSNGGGVNASLICQ